MSIQIRAMTVWQPFAHYLSSGHKAVENRARWIPPRWAMESVEPVWIAIHAGSTRATHDAYVLAVLRAGTRDGQPYYGDADADAQEARRTWPSRAIVGAARFVGYATRDGAVQWACSNHLPERAAQGFLSSPWRDRGSVGICFADAITFAEPIEDVRGQQSVWWRLGNLDEHRVAQRILAAREDACAA